MNPTGSDLYVSVPLTNVSIAYMQTSDYVADKVFTVVPVDQQGGQFYTFDAGEFNRNQMRLRGPATESAGSGWKLSQSTYWCNVFALHKDIADQDRANARAFNLDKISTMWLTGQGLLSRESSFATNFMKTGVWGSDITGVSGSPTPGTQVLQWNDNSSTPIEDIRTQMTVVQERTGFRPNVLVLTRRAWDKLADHPDLIDRIKGGATSGTPAKVQRQLLAGLLELEEVLVMEAVANNAIEGATTANAFLGGKSALLVYRPSSPSLLTPSAGYTFAWTGYLGGGSPVEIQRFRIPELKVDRIEIETAFGQQITGSALGVFFATIVA